MSDSETDVQSGQGNPFPPDRPATRVIGKRCRGWRRVVAPVAFLFVMFVYVLVVVDPRLLYHAYIVELPVRGTRIVFPEYFLGVDFLQGFLLLPGGPTEYIGAFLSQLFYFPCVGALILTGIAAGTMVLTVSLVRLLGWQWAGVAGYLPPLVLMIIWSRYTFHLADQLALMAALASIRLYLSVRRPVVRGACLPLGAAALYYVAGGPFLLAMATCGLFELLVTRKRALAILCLALAAALPLAARALTGIGLIDAFARLIGPLPLEGPVEKLTGVWEIVLAVALYGYVLVLASRPIWLPAAADSRADGLPESPSHGAGWTRLARGPALAGLLAALGIGACLAGYDRKAGRILRINYYAKTHQWDALLSHAAAYAPADMHVASIRQINRALFETGQLGDKAFGFPQVPRGLLPNVAAEELAFGPEYHLLAIGAVNQAEHLAAESLALRGPTPHTLRVLATAFIAKGEPEAGRVFLCYLSDDLIQGPWARRQLARLDADPRMSDDAEIGRIRSVMLTEDVVHMNRIEPALRRQADTGANRMAFEYLITHYLIERRLDEAVALLPSGKHYYDALPVHYGEAATLHARGPLMAPAPVGDAVCETATRRAELFVTLLGEHRDDPDAFADALVAELPDSYYRYYRTGQSGKSP